MNLSRVILVGLLGWGGLAFGQASRPVSRTPATRPATNPVGMEGSRVTLRLKGVTAKEAFEALSKEIGVALRPYPANVYEGKDGRFDLGLEGVSYWGACRALYAKTGLCPRYIGMNRDLAVAAGVPSFGGNSPEVEFGPFLVVAANVNRVANVDLNAGTEVRRTLTVRLLMHAEPKVKLLKGSYNATLDEAVDENGVAFTAAPPVLGMVDRMMAVNMAVWNMQLVLTPPANAGERIERLKAHASVVVQTKSESVEIADILNAKNVTRAVGTRKITVKELKANAGMAYVLQVRVERDPNRPNDWADINVGNTIRLVDEEGRPLARRTFTSGVQTAAADLTLMFGREDFMGGPAVGEPVKLVWEVPTEMETVVVPFELRELIVP